MASSLKKHEYVVTIVVQTNLFESELVEAVEEAIEETGSITIENITIEKD